MSSLAIGTMSGTSLDGIDIALCRFFETGKGWTFDIVDAQTIPYPTVWMDRLRHAHLLSAEEFLILHNEYGRYTGDLILEFLRGKVHPELIASHGHTIFHQPDKKFTFQLGSGASVAASTGISTISDFRILDIALGGQGAPLVPVGDQLLFSEFDYCLNIGGIANISFREAGRRIAFDICPANIILNALAIQKGYSYDNEGQIGASGTVNDSLLRQLNDLEYYKEKWPKSLGREWIENEIYPLLNSCGSNVEDQAATIYDHIASQISRVIGNKGNVLVTGGGANNSFLVKKLRDKTSCRIILPDKTLIEFKEALVFAFLGVLAFRGQVNVYSSATGSSQNHIGGTIYRIENK